MTYLSVIIPAYNEEHRLPHAIETVARYLGQQDYDSELIVVENGSTDDTTRVAWKYLMEKTMCLSNVRGRILHSPPGKGAAVCQGMFHAQGAWFYMCDSDLSTPITALDLFLKHTPNERIIIGSRQAEGSQREDEPIYRHLMGRAFNALTGLLLPGIRDTQCGFKLFFAPAARAIIRRTHTSGWAFDVEMLYIARRMGINIVEIGVPWVHDEDSRVRPLRDGLSMAWEIARIWQRGQNETTIKRVPVSV